MGLFKSAEEKAASEKQKAKAKAEAAERKAQDRYLRSPIGKATSARERGDSLLEVVLKVEDDGGRTLSDIEAVGWQLDRAGYAYDVSVSSLGNSDDQVSSVYSQSILTGVYLFRRT
ncbi:hypothetical protein AX769_20805 (plasmid) [Frondihabitans sp. PAMC 28766]|uniref:hypothetical protein n=1 Tax=Frondihabitans sp. PAMC 28766 TaxID=1795630 RepID=UPI00078DE1CC|nr:hypothetical protein [Frondihabitans sp. PAMC 28766]AMM22589.1 hypothetical protein AX769_20805 [Frondihabitans sp. PAMC 28766]